MLDTHDSEIKGEWSITAKSIFAHSFFVVLVISLVSVQGCTEEETVISGVFGEPFSIAATNYCTNHFFVDTSYIPLYESFYNNEIPIVDVTAQVISIEVWLQTLGPSQGPDDRICTVLLNLPARNSGYDPSLYAPHDTVGVRVTSRFTKLSSSSYELKADGWIGVIDVLSMVLDNQTIGVAYRRVDGVQIGDFVADRPIADSLILLKMLKPTNLASNGRRFPVSWAMQLKNHYRIGYGQHVSQHGFDLKVYRELANNIKSGEIQGHSLLTITGLDRMSDTGEPEPDGRFDFRPGFTINTDRGEFWFPTIRPFDDGITAYFDERQIVLTDSSVLFPDLYDTTKTGALNSEQNSYVIEGSAILD